MQGSRRDMLGAGAGLLTMGVTMGSAGAAPAPKESAGAAPAPKESASAAPAPKPLFDVAQSFIPVAGHPDVFPVRRIYCIGRNYADHAKEMGSDPRSEPPFFFQKPDDAVQIVPPGAVSDHPYPPLTQNYHHELELVVFLKSGGRNIAPADALSHVYGYAVGLDMTRRDLQQKMKDQRKPWEIGKSFDKSAPLGPILPVETVGHLTKGVIRLEVNGVTRQTDDLGAMIWSVAEQIAKLSESDELVAGDIIFSGTPAGVGPVVRGDRLTGHIEGLPALEIRIV